MSAICSCNNAVINTLAYNKAVKSFILHHALGNSFKYVFAETNALAYNETLSIIVVKSFII
jgi:hypothetical protein